MNAFDGINIQSISRWAKPVSPIVAASAGANPAPILRQNRGTLFTVGDGAYRAVFRTLPNTSLIQVLVYAHGVQGTYHIAQNDYSKIRAYCEGFLAKSLQVPFYMLIRMIKGCTVSLDDVADLLLS